MMIGKHLKLFRQSKSFEDNSGLYSLRAVAERWGKANSYLSDIENGKIEHPSYDAILDLLMKGYDLPFSEAKNTIAEWKVKSALKEATNPDLVLKNIQMGNNSQIITGGSNQINVNQ